MMEKKESQQEKFALAVGISLDHLESKIKPIQPSTNNVTKKEILSILNKEQKSHVKFYIKDGKNEGLTIQHLDPRQNEINSVRLQMIKHAGHFLKEGWETWHCHQEGCNYEEKEYIAYFLSFGEKPYSICRDRLRPNDEKLVIGASGTSKHLFAEHPDFVEKRLSKMGVKVSRG